VCESSPADEFLKHGSLLGPGDLEKAAEKVMQALAARGRTMIFGDRPIHGGFKG
jgi:hypothetical protein